MKESKEKREGRAKKVTIKQMYLCGAICLEGLDHNAHFSLVCEVIWLSPFSEGGYGSHNSAGMCCRRGVQESLHL